MGNIIFFTENKKKTDNDGTNNESRLKFNKISDNAQDPIINEINFEIELQVRINSQFINIRLYSIKLMI